ncbi:MAG: hypothetical protein IJV97_04440 [Alphaproteobacteria bacterium]|nr:hypothetical protein [Alphaproteobacteria bacterium]
MSSISLTSTMRANLLILQQTTSLMGVTQKNISTGKNVNSAIDNPSSYYTARFLDNRANDLNLLLDSIGQAISTVKTATEAIDTGLSFLEQALSVVEQSLSVSTVISNEEFVQFKANSAELIAEGYTSVDSTITVDEFNELLSRDNVQIVLTENLDFGDSDININGSNVVLNGGGYTLKGNSVRIGYLGDGTTEINNITLETAKGVNHDAYRNLKLNNVKIVNNGINNRVEQGMWGINSRGDSILENVIIEVKNSQNYNAIGIRLYQANCKLNNVKIDLLTRDDGVGRGIIGDGGDEKELLISNLNIEANSVDRLGILGSFALNDDEYKDVSVNIDEKFGENDYAYYTGQYDEIVRQYDNLVEDATYKGVNLLKADNLIVNFNEDRSSKLKIIGKDVSSGSLGLKPVLWNDKNDIGKTLNDLRSSINLLRDYASEIGNSYSILVSRENFTNDLINVLTEGADKLTLADMNEESANMLALQTRQQLAINALSLASQASKSVLELF